MKLDETEMKLLREMQKDGRASRRVLADRIDVSTPTVSSKIEKLENMGIIKGFTVEIDHRKLGLQKYFIHIESEDKTEEKIQKLFSGFEGFRKIEKLEGGNHLITLFVHEFSQLDKATEYLEGKDGVKIDEIKRAQSDDSKFPLIPLDENVPLDITCYYCNKPIKGEPKKWNEDGKEHYFCCSSCKDLYEDKYERLKQRKKEMKGGSQ